MRLVSVARAENPRPNESATAQYFVAMGNYDPFETFKVRTLHSFSLPVGLWDW